MSYKALELSAELADELKKRVRPLVITTAFDGNGDPVLTISDGTPAAGEKVVVIRTKAIDWPLGKDVLGLASTVYTPHVMQICTEANYAGATDNVADILTPNEILPIVASVVKRGTRVEWYQSANGTVPDTTQMTSGNLKASYEAELYWGQLASS